MARKTKEKLPLPEEVSELPETTTAYDAWVAGIPNSKYTDFDSARRLVNLVTYSNDDTNMKSRAAHSIEEIEKHFKKVIHQGKKIFLYNLEFMRVVEVLPTGVLELEDIPKSTQVAWKVSYREE